MNTQRAYGASMVVDNALYFIGGLDGALHVDSVSVLCPLYSEEANGDL
jgi:hypothetical protein